MKELKGVRRSYACLAGWELKAKTFRISIQGGKGGKGS